MSKRTKYKTQQKKSRKKKKRLRALSFRKILVILFLLGITSAAVWYFSFDYIDPSDFVSVSYTGYDTKGTAHLSVLPDDTYLEFLKSVHYEIKTENGNLRNGDALEISVTYNKEETKKDRIRLKKNSFQKEVTGLPECKRLSSDDLFKNAKISYKGTAPELAAEITNQGTTGSFLDTITYQIMNHQNYYDIGDSIQIKAVLDQEEAVAMGYQLPSSKDSFIKEYKIENADHFLRDPALISKHEIQELNQNAASLFGDAREYGLRIFSEANLMPVWVNNKTTFIWSNPRLHAVYFNILKPENFGTISLHDNDLNLIYKVTLSQADGVACDAEVIVRFTDLLCKADGSIDLAADSGKIIAASYSTKKINGMIDNIYNEAYESIEVNF